MGSWSLCADIRWSFTANGRMSLHLLILILLVWSNVTSPQGRWWFGTRQKTKDGVNARSAAVFFKSLKEGSGMDEVVGILGKAFEWEWSKAQKTATTEVDGIEAKIEQNLGDKWRQIRRQAGSVGHDYFDSKRKALVLLYSHLLRIPVSNSLRKGPSDHCACTYILTHSVPPRANPTIASYSLPTEFFPSHIDITQLAYPNPFSNATTCIPHPGVDAWE